MEYYNGNYLEERRSKIERNEDENFQYSCKITTGCIFRSIKVQSLLIMKM